MCGRFTLKADIETIAKVFHVKPSLAVAEITPRYNIAPTQEVVSILSNGASHLEPLRWGLIPSWAKDEAICGTCGIALTASRYAVAPSSLRSRMH